MKPQVRETILSFFSNIVYSASDSMVKCSKFCQVVRKVVYILHCGYLMFSVLHCCKSTQLKKDINT